MASDLFSVKDQIVVVSGASRGIGRAIAQAFIDAGATVVITGRVAETVTKAAEEITRGEGRAVGKVCDVADHKAIGPFVDEVIAEYGRIDTLVNCAGVNKRKKIEDYSEDEYDFITNINIKGAFIMSQAVGRHMIAAGSGSIINIDSINSHTPLKRVGPYAMSKAAMSQMTKVMAMEWGPHGVRVNGIGPGFTRTELASTLWEDAKMRQWRDDNIPMGRVAEPEDMAGTCIYLASKAAAYVTGQVIYIDGGTVSGLFWPIPD
ncbi:MAG: glucose 1-dehydrogenase [Pirellulales bacterium]|nr:glucose 1-dehydrogenase [Pirellulales bacterium]